MRILVMADASSVHTGRWCGYFEQAGFDVALFSLEDKKIKAPTQFYPAKRPTSIKFLDYYLAKKKFLQVVNDFKPDIVNPHFVVSYGYLATFCKSVPIACTAWGSDLLLLPQRSPFHKRRIARALKSASVCIVDGENLAGIASQYMPENKIHNMVWGVDREVMNPTPILSNKKGTSARIMAPRGLPDVYDPQTIIKAAGLLKGKIDLEITMRGEDDLIDRYQKLIDDSNLSSVISLTPIPNTHLEHVADLYNYDMYLSASLSDSTSVSLLEAMAVGLYPVVSDIPGNRGWITDGQNGTTFKPGSAESLAEAIQKALTMRDRFEEVAQHNHKIISERAIWQDQMKRVEDLFRRLVR